MLESIQSPFDIKRLNLKELEMLADEIRSRLLSVISTTGGHLASNLGAVEMTLALHYVYDFPTDKIVWDVGHQAYTHKILTGRNDMFDDLRCIDGLSGFPKICESSYDCFGTGHASTSISAAVGFALARDRMQQSHNVLAAIGDGALTGGMVYEAFNHAGHLNLNMKVILNDNDMSIDNNVGGLSDYLTFLRSDPHYRRAKSDIDTVLKNVPALGSRMAEMADRLNDSLRYMVVPGAFFEELGFKYYGPINGHDLEALIHVFKNIKALKRPILVHCVTKKGKGYYPAELQPDKFHGTGPFEIKTGISKNKKSTATYTDVFAETLLDLAEKDEKIVAITAAMASGTGLSAFSKKYPERIYDVGIAEEHAVTMSSSLALSGMKPVLAIYSTFLQRGFDQLIHDMALQNAPLLICVDRAGLVGEDGPTHHGNFDLSYLRIIPNLLVMAPKDERELQNMMYSALQYDKPAAIRYPRGGGYGVKTSKDYEFIPEGKSEVLREGNDLTILAVGSLVYSATQCADKLAEQGLSVGVVNSRFVKPLDEDMLKAMVGKTKAFVTMEENTRMGGFGSAILEWLSDQNVQMPLKRIGIGDFFVEQGNTSILKERIGLSVDKMYLAILEWVKERANEQ